MSGLGIGFGRTPARILDIHSFSKRWNDNVLLVALVVLAVAAFAVGLMVTRLLRESHLIPCRTCNGLR